MKLFGIISVRFDATNQLQIIFSAFLRYWRKYGNTRYSTSAIHRLLKAYDLEMKEVLYNILIEYEVTMKLVQLFKNV
jgi:hypothetical protein